MPEQVNLSNGGIATVFIGHTGFIKEYANNPQVRFIDCKAVDQRMLSDLVPSNTKVIVVAEGVGQLHYQWASAYNRQKKVPYVVKKSNQAIYDFLKGCFPEGKEKVSQEEATQTREKGKLKNLIQFINFGKSNSENGRILLDKAVESGIKTTIGSVTQLVANERRKQGQTSIPKSARPKLDLSVEILENMIKELIDMKEFLVATVEENRILKSKVDKFKKAIED